MPVVEQRVTMSSPAELRLAGPGAPAPAQARSPQPKRRKRLLLITDTDLALRGGSECFLIHLLEGLDPSAFSIDVIQLDKAPDAARVLPADSEYLKLEYRPLGAIYGFRAWKLWRELKARVRQGSYDVIQSQHEKSDLLCALLPAGPGRALRVSNRRDTGFQKGFALRGIFRLVNHRFDLVIAPAREILTQLIQNEGVERQRTRCLPNGVDCNRFQPVDLALRRALRADQGLPVDGYLFACVARMVPVKRHCDLLDGFALIARDYPQARLVMVGRGPLENDLRAQVARLDLVEQVIFFGEGRDMEHLLPLFDACLLTSSTEGLSNAILEAMASGLPTIATAVGGNPELIDSHRTGILVPPFSVEVLAEAMFELLSRPDHGRAMGRQARARAERDFSLAAMVDAYSGFYRSHRAVEPA
jgi:L-malate glycosyltransferase